MKKRITMLVLQICLALSICACGSTEATVEEPITAEELEDEPEEEVSTNEQVDVETNAEPPTDEETTEAEVATEETVDELLEENTEKDLKEESVMSLEEWVKTPEKEEAVQIINDELVSSGLKCDFDATGNKFICKYVFIDFQDLSELTEEEIHNNFDTNVSPVLADAAESLASAFVDEYGIVIDTIRVEIYNADDTEIFAKDYDVE